MKTKIFSGTVRSALKQCLDEGYLPANMKTVWQMQKNGEIENRWYDTGTIFIDGEIRGATLEELRNIEQLYEKGSRLLCLDVGDYGVFAIWLGGYGQFVGVRPEDESKSISSESSRLDDLEKRIAKLEKRRRK